MAIDIIITLVGLSFLFSYSLPVGFISLFTLPLYFLAIRSQNKNISLGQKTAMAGYSMSESNYISTLQGIEPIKNYNKQIIYEGINNVIYEKYQKGIFSLGKIQIKLSFIANSFGIFFLVSILFFTANKVLYGYLKTGELMAILGICSSLLPSIANLALISIPISEAKVAFDRMFEFTSIPPEYHSKINDKINFEALNVTNLTYRFAGRSPILRNLSIDIIKGQIIAIMGENGSGKSTLMQILQKNYEYESGNIIINSSGSFKDISLSKWRNLVASVPQNIHIFNSSVLENIAFEDAVSNPQKVVDFLESFGFLRFLNSLPQSVFTLIGEEGISLSGGQKQMIALARALYHKPQLLILDEATAAMDRESEQFVLQLLKGIKNEMGIIFITHRLHVLKSFCDKIYILENGTISSFGNHEKLLQSKNLYSTYWNDLID